MSKENTIPGFQNLFRVVGEYRKVSVLVGIDIEFTLEGTYLPFQDTWVQKISSCSWVNIPVKRKITCIRSFPKNSSDDPFCMPIGDMYYNWSLFHTHESNLLRKGVDHVCKNIVEALAWFPSNRIGYFGDVRYTSLHILKTICISFGVVN